MPWTVGSGCCGIESRRLVGDTSTQTALLSIEQRPARCLRNTAHQFLAGQVNSEGLNKSHEGQPSGTSGFDPNHELDCPVPRLTLLFFGAAKDVPEAAKTVTAGTACLHLEAQANGQTWSCFQATPRPLKRCTSKEITAMINRR